MLKVALYNWWLLVDVQKEKDSVLIGPLRVWPCSIEYLDDTNWTFFKFYFCFYFFEREVTKGGGHGKTGKWLWSRYVIWNSQRINNKVMFKTENGLEKELKMKGEISLLNRVKSLQKMTTLKNTELWSILPMDTSTKHPYNPTQSK